ncbi:MAG: protein translocase SEC61 complex subunit gamma [Candidatus Geothermarchaeota archaeon]
MLKKFEEYIRILRLAKKPTLKEFWQYLKVILVGVSVLGLVAYLVKMIFGLFIVR